uniref:Uncharacterized protein LOC113794958 n=1 Tax=Dermatophagoides pteronyssinus TaxID=6956 RepID=A0A6P6Y7E2_DERPT|nr:uncharacterized protein LOC113794958 [Dermatophagoides pteronyssinus]
MITIQTGRFLFYVWLSFMDESVIRSYCQYDTTAAPLFDYHNHDNDGTSLNITDSCLTSIIWSIYFGFVLHSHYMLFLTNRNSLTWHLLYDISIRNYDHYRNSIVHLQGENMLRTIIKTLNNSNDFNELISDSSPRIIHNYLAKMLRKKHKTFIDKLFIRLMLNIDLHNFAKLRLKVFRYAGLKQRIELTIAMFIIHCLDVFLLTFVISTTLNLACVKYFNFIRIHMWNLWPLALFDFFYASQMNNLNKMLIQVFGNRRHMINLRLNYLRQLIWRQFQRQHQHMTYCIMYSGNDVWNSIYFMVASLLNYSAHQFKRQLPTIQSYMKEPAIKWQVHEFYERLSTTGNGFGFYCGPFNVLFRFNVDNIHIFP